MARTDAAPRVRRGWLYAAVGLLAVGVVIVAFGLRRPPQIGTDERAFRTVDALYTAVRARNVARVAECEKRLHDHRDAGRLPAAAANYLDGIIRDARADRWQPATERLYEFMIAQRRESP